MTGVANRASASRRLATEVRAIALLAAVRILLMTAGLTRTLRWVEVTARWQRRPMRPGELAYIVNRGRHAVPGAACVARAATLVGLLLAQGDRPTLVIGVRRDDQGAWGGHAWVELPGATGASGEARGEHAPMAVFRSDSRWVGEPPTGLEKAR